jgi:hypothetical protein
VQGFAIGGLSELPRATFGSARLASMLATEFGMFGFKPHVLADLLVGKRVDVRPGEETYWRTLSGVQRPADLATALQLIHKLFTTDVRACCCPYTLQARQTSCPACSASLAQ